MLKINKILVILIYLPILASGQMHKGFQWIGPDHSIYSVNLKTGILSQTAPKKSEVKIGKLKNWDILKDELPGDFGVNSFYQGDSLIIAIPGTGQVYNFKISNLELKRLDQTFFRGYNFNANQFFRNDTLFSIGGEGFWLKHSIITYYNPKTFEWTFYKTQTNNNHIVTNKFSGYSKKHDTFFSSFLESGWVLTKEDIPIMFYSFGKDKWENKGALSKTIIQLAKRSYRSIWTGQYLILDFDSNESKIFIADPFENILYEHTNSDDHFFMQNCELYYRNGKIFSRSIASLGKIEKTYFDSLSVDSLIKQSNIVDKVYKSNYYNDSAIMAAIGGLILIISSSIFYYRKRRIKAENYILTEIELLVVKKFINHSIGTKISSNELNNLLEISTKTYDNQRQIRYRIIGAINQKLRADLDFKDLINRSSNIEDKRMMDYYINPEIKPKDLDKLKKKLIL